MPSPKTIDELIMILPKKEQVIVKRLRALIHECLPAATEKAYYDWGVPFYTRHRLICYIWPGSLVWSSKGATITDKPKPLKLGFCQGNLMSNEDGALLVEGRKQVYVLYIRSLDDIREDQIRALLFEAGMIDDMFGEKKKKRDRKK